MATIRGIFARAAFLVLAVTAPLGAQDAAASQAASHQHRVEGWERDDEPRHAKSWKNRPPTIRAVGTIAGLAAG